MLSDLRYYEKELRGKLHEENSPKHRYFFLHTSHFNSCASKDIKKFGGELYLRKSKWWAYFTAVTLTLKWAIYGIGALLEVQEEWKIFEPQKGSVDTSEK